jgi:hypothetical protein
MRKIYIHSSAGVLALLATGKIINVIEGPRSLLEKDPLFGLPYGRLLLLAAILELAAALLCWIKIKSEALCVTVLLTLASMLFAYRLGLWAVNWKQPCSCLGALTGGLGISVATADLVSKTILFGLIGGGYYLLWQSRRTAKNDSIQHLSSTTNVFL